MDKEIRKDIKDMDEGSQQHLLKAAFSVIIEDHSTNHLSSILKEC